jgi:parallel beta-helix repeat protein
MKVLPWNYKIKSILCLLFVFSSLINFSATFYVSNSGNDSNTGLSESQAWKTLARVNSKSFVAGDQILLKSGDTFYGSLSITNSGTSAYPIILSTYGSGAKPIITGFTTINSWVNLGNNIWESSEKVSTLSSCNMVTIDGVNTPIGRYPNATDPMGGYLTVNSSSGETSISCSSLSGTPNWTGAEVVARVNRWTLRISDITSQSGNMINFNSLGFTPTLGSGFFIQNDSRTLDKQNEWFYNSSTKKIQVFSKSQPGNVKVASRDTLINLSGNYIIVDNLNVIGSNSKSIYSWKSWNSPSHHITIRNCAISYSGGAAIYVRGNYLNVENNNISESNQSAIDACKSGIVNIKNNNIQNTFLVKECNSSSGAIIADYQVKSAIIEYNRIVNSGMNGISCLTDSTMLIKNNYIDTFNTILDDGAGIYLGGSNTFGISIIGNICINGIGNGFGTTDTTSSGSRGIFLDDNSSNMEVSYNTCANIGSYGIFIHNSSFNNVHHNTVFNCYKSQLLMKDDPISSAPTENNTIANNIFVSKSLSQYTLYVATNYDNILSFGNFNNNFYSRPIDDNKTIRVYAPKILINKTLAQWQTFSGQDANSKQSPQTITSENDIQFEYNDTKAVKTVNLMLPMIDVKGTKYAGSITLQPFTSAVLLKDYKPTKYSTEYKSICDGLSYNGWTTTGKYERTLIAKSGSDSIVTTYLNVNPKYAIHEVITILSGETYQGWSTSGTYSRILASKSGCDSVITTNLIVDLSSIKVGELTQVIELTKGNNLISTYLQVNNEDASILTQTIRNSGYLIKMQDELGNSYENWGSLGGWINNLGPIQNTEGYKIIVANNCTLQIIGKQLALPFNISLNEGWNIIPFPRADILDAKMIIQSLIDQNVLVKVQDETGNSIEDWGNYGGWKNNIGNFVPGKAYKVKVKSNTVLTYQQNYPKSSLIQIQSEKPDFFSTSVEGNGIDHFNINLVGLSESGLVIGDEVAAFDGTRCVGALKITNDNLLTGSASLISSYSTNEQNPDGFIEGDPIRIFAWNKITGKKTEVQFEVINGEVVFKRNASSFVQIKSLTTSFPIHLVSEISSNVFPNPSQGFFTVRFSEIPDQDGRIEVLDSSGRIIASRKIISNSEEFSLENPVSGLYFVKTIIGSIQNIHKLVIK